MIGEQILELVRKDQKLKVVYLVIQDIKKNLVIDVFQFLQMLDVLIMKHCLQTQML